jgi:hypothetical protein
MPPMERGCNRTRVSISKIKRIHGTMIVVNYESTELADTRFCSDDSGVPKSSRLLTVHNNAGAFNRRVGYRTHHQTYHHAIGKVRWDAGPDIMLLVISLWAAVATSSTITRALGCHRHPTRSTLVPEAKQLSIPVFEQPHNAISGVIQEPGSKVNVCTSVWDCKL